MPYFNILVFIIGLLLLIKGADWVTKYAAKLAKKWGISEFTIGLTLVAVATSLPEISISVISGFTDLFSTGAVNIATGTIIGSNIANIGLVLGIAATIRPLSTNAEYMRQEYFMVVLTLLFAALLLMQLNTLGGLLLIAVIFSYIYYLIGKGRTRNPILMVKVFYEKITTRETISDILLSFAGGVLLIFGSILIINSVINISVAFGISEFFIALVVIAIGTSLPELSASVAAALKGLRGISIGNIIGSNIANILAISLTALITTVKASPQIIINTYIMLFFALIFLLFAKSQLEISKKEGMVLLILYAGFVAVQVLLAG